MKTKEFHLGDVLSITTERLVSLRHIDGVYDILNFMTGDDLFTHQLPRASDECKPYLLKQFPQLGTPAMDAEVAKLDEMLKTQRDKKDNEKLINGWVLKLTKKYGERFAVQPIPREAHVVKNPLQEAAEMTGGADKVIPVVVR